MCFFFKYIILLLIYHINLSQSQDRLEIRLLIYQRYTVVNF
jgi:hypothetical protein